MNYINENINEIKNYINENNSQILKILAQEQINITPNVYNM